MVWKGRIGEKKRTQGLGFRAGMFRGRKGQRVDKRRGDGEVLKGEGRKGEKAKDQDGARKGRC